MDAPTGRALRQGEDHGFRLLPIERLSPGPGQPRKRFDAEALAELAESIKSQGVLQPIIACRRGDDFEIVAGERRWRAAQQAGLHKVPVLVKELSNAAVLQVALIENIQRQDLDPLEEAMAYTGLIREHGLTHEGLATAVGKKRSTITNSLRLLKLPDPVQSLLIDGSLSVGHARVLAGVSSPALIQGLAKDIIAKGWTVRETERRAKDMLLGRRGGGKQKGDDTDSSKRSSSSAHKEVEARLERALSTKVRLHCQKGRGRIEVFFDSLDGLDSLLEQMCSG